MDTGLNSWSFYHLGNYPGLKKTKVKMLYIDVRTQIDDIAYGEETVVKKEN